MVANIRGYTDNYKFKLINFDTPRWHTLEYANWNMVDALFLQSSVPQSRGGWQNNTAYLEGDRTFDEETSASYRCLVSHTSAATGTFADDRILHPTYWSLQLAGVPVYRGDWVPSVAYVLGDIVCVDDYTFYLCTVAHTASVAFPADALYWQQVFDAAQVVIDAEAAKDAAYQFSLDAQSSANDAQSSEDDAQLAEDAAKGWANDARAATGGFRWAYSSSTTAADPAVGRVAFNSAIPASVTEVYLSAYSGEIGNPDVSDWVATWDDSTNVLTRGTLQLRKIGAPEQFMIFELLGNIVDNGAWLKLPVAYINHSGSITNGEAVSLGFVRAGNQGPTGTGGGDMLRANNLNDVVSVPTSRTNLGLGTAQIPTFSQVLLGNDPSAPMHAATRQYVDSSPSLVISDTAPNPTTSLAGTLWWDSDLGTLFVLYDDGNSKQWVQATATPGIDTTPLVKKAGDTMTGDLTITKSTPLMVLNDTGGVVGDVRFNRNGGRRWIMRMNGTTEAGGNVGSDFQLLSYQDDGTNLSAVHLTGSRADGRLSVYADPVVPLGIATKQYVDARASGDFVAMSNGSIVTSASAGALTIAIKTTAGADPSVADPVYFNFQNSIATAAGAIRIAVTAPLSVTIPSGATLGTTNGAANRIWVSAHNNAGTVVLGVIKCRIDGGVTAGVFRPQEHARYATAALPGNQQTAFYTTTAIPGGAVWRLIGFCEWTTSTIAVAGTWVVPDLVSLVVPGSALPGDVVQYQRCSSAVQTTVNSTAYISSSLSMSVTHSKANFLEFFATGTMFLGAVTYGSSVIYNYEASSPIGSAATTFGGEFGNVGSNTNYALYLPNRNASSYTVAIYNNNGAGNITYPNTGTAELMCRELMS